MTELNMIYWKSGKFWLGKFKEHPEIMTQGRTLKELEENLKDAYLMMVVGGMKQAVPRHNEIQDILAKHIRKHLGLE